MTAEASCRWWRFAISKVPISPRLVMSRFGEWRCGIIWHHDRHFLYLVENNYFVFCKIQPRGPSVKMFTGIVEIVGSEPPPSRPLHHLTRNKD